jgi:exosortase E/protease (VPEID-CTERM system)
MDKAGQERLPQPLLILAATLLAESLIAGSLPHPWFHLHQIMAAPIVFTATFLFFGRRALHNAALDNQPVQRGFLLFHALALAGLVSTTIVLLRLLPPASPVADAPLITFSPSFWCVALWYASILALIATLTLALLPISQLVRTLAGLRSAWIYATVLTIATMSARLFVRWIWDAPNSAFGRALQQGTFYGSRRLLQLFYPQVISVPATHILGTPSFLIEVAGTCSGIEGLALILVFTCGWLVFARRELYLTRAIFLVPVALAVSWLLNLVRIAALIAIGNAGHPDTAINGFHSEAGWILFNAVAIGFLLVVQRLRWLQRKAVPPRNVPMPSTRDEHNTAAIYLLPFLLVLATSLLTHAASNGFDWLYPLRLIVAIAALWHFRKHYAQLDWHFSWLGPTVGAAVFLLWIASAHLQNTPANTALQTDLAHLATWQRVGWLAARTFAAVITVPIAEELAFRGYLARRIIANNPESVPFSRLSLAAILGSSIAFGLLHGQFWLAGIAAGILFALAAKKQNRIGEAVAAHATANLLLAIWVLTRGDYTLW